MKKVVKLTESDLYRIIKRVIKEQSEMGLISKLREEGFEFDDKSGSKTKLVKKIPGVGEFLFDVKKDGADFMIINPNQRVISNFKLNMSSKKHNLGFKSEPDAERIAHYIMKAYGEPQKQINPTPQPQNPVVDTPFPMDEERFDFEKMSDEELHDLHPRIKKHPKHFKDFTPTSEFLGWRGEVDKRNIYKRHGKFHNAFDDEK